MRLSLVIPSYNQQEYLSEAIESVLAQTRQPDEFIVVDDGSTDGSLKLAQSYKVKVISQVNKGLASARNTGIMNATGDYIFWLDADDMLVDNCLERICQVIETTGADIVAPSFKCFGEGKDQVTLAPTITLEMFKNYQNYLPYFCAIKRDKLLEIGGYSPRMIWGWEDLHLWINLLSRGSTIATIPETLVLYRTKKDSMYTRSRLYEYELKTQIKKDFPKCVE